MPDQPAGPPPIDDTLVPLIAMQTADGLPMALRQDEAHAYNTVHNRIIRDIDGGLGTVIVAALERLGRLRADRLAALASDGEVSTLTELREGADARLVAVRDADHGRPTPTPTTLEEARDAIREAILDCAGDVTAELRSSNYVPAGPLRDLVEAFTTLSGWLPEDAEADGDAEAMVPLASLERQGQRATRLAMAVDAVLAVASRYSADELEGRYEDLGRALEALADDTEGDRA